MITYMKAELHATNISHCIARVDSRMRKKLFVCVLAITCVFLALMTAPAYFRVSHIVYKDGLLKVPLGENTFTIVQFADVHFGEGDEKDTKSIHAMQSILLAETGTDMVVFSGDQVSGWLIPTSKYYHK